jgi:hypothetical protein
MMGADGSCADGEIETNEPASLAELLARAAAADGMTRIDFRDPIAAHGAEAIAALGPWLGDPRLAGFAVRAIERAGVAAPVEARAALERARRGASGTTRIDVDDALRRLPSRSSAASRGVPSLDLPELTTETPAILVKLAEWVAFEDRELPRVGYGYRPGLAGEELYESARAWWVLDQARAARYPYAVAVYQGVTLDAWEIVEASWRSWDAPTTGRTRRRWAFEGRPVAPDVHDAFVGALGRRVPRLRPGGGTLFGSGSAVAYWPK